MRFPPAPPSPQPSPPSPRLPPAGPSWAACWRCLLGAWAAPTWRQQRQRRWRVRMLRRRQTCRAARRWRGAWSWVLTSATRRWVAASVGHAGGASQASAGLLHPPWCALQHWLEQSMPVPLRCCPQPIPFPLPTLHPFCLFSIASRTCWPAATCRPQTCASAWATRPGCRSSWKERWPAAPGPWPGGCPCAAAAAAPATPQRGGTAWPPRLACMPPRDVAPPGLHIPLATLCWRGSCCWPVASPAPTY